MMINDQVHDKFESIRAETYARLLGSPEITEKQARRNMQMCYVMNATVSSMSIVI